MRKGDYKKWKERMLTALATTSSGGWGERKQDMLFGIRQKPDFGRIREMTKTRKNGIIHAEVRR